MLNWGPRVANIVFQKSLETSRGPAQPPEEPAGFGVLFPFLSGGHRSLLQNRVKVVNFRVLAGGFVMECAKQSWF